MDDKNDKCTVNIVTESPALPKPTFVIKCGGKYYATLAVWEYDPDTHGLTSDQKTDIEALGRLFEKAREKGPVHEAVEITDINIICFGASKIRAS